MTNDIREKADALVKALEAEDCCNVTLKEFKDLKAALHPSRKEISNYLENYNTWRRGGHDDMPEPKELGKYLELAIEELRK